MWICLGTLHNLCAKQATWLWYRKSLRKEASCVASRCIFLDVLSVSVIHDIWWFFGTMYVLKNCYDPFLGRWLILEFVYELELWCYTWFVSFEMPWSVVDCKCILVNAAQLVYFGDVSRVIHIPAVVAVSTSRTSWLLLQNCDVVEHSWTLYCSLHSIFRYISLGILQDGQWCISIVGLQPLTLYSVILICWS